MIEERKMIEKEKKDSKIEKKIDIERHKNRQTDRFKEKKSIKT